MNNFIKQNLAIQFEFLLSQLINLDNTFIEKRHIPEKWSIREHLAHLSRYQEIFLERMAVIQKKDAVSLERYRAEDDQGFYAWCELTTGEIIQSASKTRLEIIDFLLNLPYEQIQKTGTHPKLGRMNIEDWTSFFLLHESHHIYAIFGLMHRFFLTENT